MNKEIEEIEECKICEEKKKKQTCGQISEQCKTNSNLPICEKNSFCKFN